MRTTVRFCTLIALAASSVLVALPAHAGGDCGCTHTVMPGTTAVNGTELGYQPGDVVCVMAGSYEYIRFREIRGDENNPIVIKNCGGVVEVSNEDRAYAIDFQGSSHHFHLTGTGDPNVSYGFRVRAPATEPYPGVGLWFLDKSTDYEADHIEVYETGFAGVMSKTDPLCDGSADQDVFVQRNVHLHHMWVHDTGGEGFYVGSTQSGGHTITCDNQREVHQPHFLEGIEIDHMLIEDTGWDGMQVGMARQGCGVHDNVIRRVGGAGVEFQQQGLQIGTYSSCDVRRNSLSDGPQMGIIVLGAYDSTFADNVIARFGADGIYANLNMTPGPVAYRVAHNTILGFGGSAVRVFGDQIENGVAWNNLVIGAEGAIAISNDVGWASEGNVFVSDTAAARFVDAAADDFHLLDDSPARAAGVDHIADGFVTDRDGLLRASPPAVGAYEHVTDSPTGGTGGGGGGASGPGATTGTMVTSAASGGPGATGAGGGAPDREEGDGCDCSSGRGSSGPALSALALVAIALGAGRGRLRRRARSR